MNPIELTSVAGRLEQTVATIFRTMLGLEVNSVNTDGSPGSKPVTATIHFSGGWSGVLMLEVSASLACQFTASFLSMDLPESVDDDVRDVVGELANMISGNLKGTLAPGSIISIPEVIDGSDFKVRICNSTISERRAFCCGDDVFWVSLVQTPRKYEGLEPAAGEV